MSNVFITINDEGVKEITVPEGVKVFVKDDVEGGYSIFEEGMDNCTTQKV
jgi:hypothetical protein